jgi:hypothetical protein
MSEQVSSPEVSPAPPPAARVPQTSNGFAVASLVLGIVGVVLSLTLRVGLICDVLAIVFGALGYRRAREGAPNGGLAKAGMILGIVGLGALVLLFIFVRAFGWNGGHLYRFGAGHRFMRRY